MFFRARHKAVCRAIKKQRKLEAQAQLDETEAAAETAGLSSDTQPSSMPPCDYCGEPSTLACAAGCGIAHFCGEQHQLDGWSDSDFLIYASFLYRHFTSPNNLSLKQETPQESLQTSFAQNSGQFFGRKHCSCCRCTDSRRPTTPDG